MLALVLVVAGAVLAAQAHGGTLENMNLFPAAEAPFLNGIASGDPLPDAVLIWTRITTNATVSETLDWALWDPSAPGQSQAAPLASGSVAALPENDWTVTVDVTSLTAGTRYAYQFSDSLGRLSEEGRTKTASTSGTAVNVGVVSCTSIWNGYMNYYRHMAARTDLDFVTHLGDFVYPETTDVQRMPFGLCQYDLWWKKDAANYGGQPEDNDDPYLQALVTRFNCSEGGELQKYRWVHELYSLDPDFRALRAAHPIIAILDDHDTGNLTKNDDPAPISNEFRGALRASLEWIPTRYALSAVGAADFVFLPRRFRFGGTLLDFVALDTRNLIEIDVADGMLGTEQNAWLDAELPTAAAATWRVFGTTKEFMPFTLNGVPAAMNLMFGLTWLVLLLLLAGCAGANVWHARRQARAAWNGSVVPSKRDADLETSAVAGGPTSRAGRACAAARKESRAVLAAQRQAPRCGKVAAYCGLFWFLLWTLVWIVGAAVLNANLNGSELVYLDGARDGWEGLPASRERLLQQLDTAGAASNNVFASGDMHISLANDVFSFDYTKKQLLDYDPSDAADGPFKHYGVEFMPASGSRDNLDDRAAEAVGLSASSSLVQSLISYATTLIQAANPHFRWSEFSGHGYGVLTATADKVDAQFIQFERTVITNEPRLTKTMTLRKDANRWD